MPRILFVVRELRLFQIVQRALTTAFERRDALGAFGLTRLRRRLKWGWFRNWLADRRRSAGNVRLTCFGLSRSLSPKPPIRHSRVSLLVQPIVAYGARVMRLRAQS